MGPETNAPPARGVPEKQALDLKLISDLVMQLNIVRKNTALYPLGHPQLDATLGRVQEYLDQHFAYSDHLTLAITKDSLILEDMELPRGNPIFSEFAKSLHDHSIYSFSVKIGLTGRELHLFNRILGRDREVIAEGETLAQALDRHPLPHMELGLLDMDQFEFTEEFEVDLDSQLKAEGGSGATWQSYIKRMLDKGSEEFLTEDEDGIELTNVDPEMLAEFLNRLEKRSDNGLTYDKAVASYLHDSSSTQQSMDRISDTRVRSSFINLVNSLNADLRAEFLNEDFQFSSRARGVSPAIFDDKRAQIVLEILEEINQSEMKVHPRMFEILDRLAAFDNQPGQEVEMVSELDEDQEHDFRQMSLSYFTTFGFRKRASDEDRKKWAGTLAEKLNGNGEPEGQGQIQLTQRSINLHFAQTMLDLVERSKDPEDVEDACRVLADAINDHVIKKQWRQVIYIWNQLDELDMLHGETNPVISENCRRAKLQFWHPENISQMSCAILDHGIRDSEDLVDILRYSCQESAQSMVRALARETDEKIKRILARLVLDLKDYTMPHVAQMLNDQSPAVQQTMLEIVRYARDKSPMVRVVELVDSPDDSVRLEALRTLTVLGFPDAPLHIIRFLRDEDSKIAISAMESARLIHSKKVNQALLEIVLDKRLHTTDFDMDRKLSAVRTLSFIGSSEVLPALYKLVRTRLLFNQKNFEKVRMEVFRTIEGYPLDKLDKFIKYGLKSKDILVSNIAKSLARKTNKE